MIMAPLLGSNAWTVAVSSTEHEIRAEPSYNQRQRRRQEQLCADAADAIMTGDNRARRISMVVRKVAPIHLVRNQYFRLYCFRPEQAAGVGDRNRRSGFF